MKKQQQALVSVCLPVKDGSRYLQLALDSLKSQTYQNLELIVSDDNSKDHSLELVKNFQKTWKFPVSIHHHQPTTIGANWNNCLKNAKGKYIKFLFQDDLLYPECIERMVMAAEADEQVNLVFCKRDLIYENNTHVSDEWRNEFEDLQKKQTIFKNSTKIPGKKLLKSSHLLEEPINKIGEPITVLFRRNMIEKAGNFNEQLSQLLDIEYWYRIMKSGSVAFLNEKLVAFRIHQNQATAINNDQEIKDYDLFPKMLYNNYFWQLHFQVQKKLFFKYNSIGVRLSQIVS